MARAPGAPTRASLHRGHQGPRMYGQGLGNLLPGHRLRGSTAPEAKAIPKHLRISWGRALQEQGGWGFGGGFCLTYLIAPDPLSLPQHTDLQAGFPSYRGSATQAFGPGRQHRLPASGRWRPSISAASLATPGICPSQSVRAGAGEGTTGQQWSNLRKPSVRVQRWGSVRGYPPRD